VRVGRIFDAASLEQLLVSHRRMTLETCDAWFAARAHRACADGDGERLVQLAERDQVARPSLVQRRAANDLGARMLDVSLAVFGQAEEAQALRWVASTLGARRPLAVVSGAVVWAVGGSDSEAAEAVVYSATATCVSAALRLGVLGSTAAQGVLSRVLAPGIGELADEPASFSPLFDLAGLQREIARDPLFCS
jgi:urease accessory protein UreF